MYTQETQLLKDVLFARYPLKNLLKSLNSLTMLLHGLTNIKSEWLKAAMKRF